MVAFIEYLVQARPFAYVLQCQTDKVDNTAILYYTLNSYCMVYVWLNGDFQKLCFKLQSIQLKWSGNYDGCSIRHVTKAIPMHACNI